MKVNLIKQEETSHCLKRKVTIQHKWPKDTSREELITQVSKSMRKSQYFYGYTKDLKRILSKKMPISICRWDYVLSIGLY